MKATTLTFFAVVAAVSFLSCVPEKSPLIANASGTIASLVARYEDGRSSESQLPDGAVLWAGRVDAKISLLEVRVSGRSYSLSAIELQTPLVGEKFAAFILRTSGAQKVQLKQAIAVAKIKA